MLSAKGSSHTPRVSSHESAPQRRKYYRDGRKEKTFGSVRNVGASNQTGRTTVAHVRDVYSGWTITALGK